VEGNAPSGRHIRVVQVPLEAGEELCDLLHTPELRNGIADPVVSELDEIGEFLLIELPHPCPDVLTQHEVQEGLLLSGVAREDEPAVGGAEAPPTLSPSPAHTHSSSSTGRRSGNRGW